MPDNAPNSGKKLHTFLWHPVSAFVGAVLVLASGLIASYLLGQLSVGGILAATAMLIIAVATGAAVALLIGRHLVLPELMQVRAAQETDRQAGVKALELTMSRFDQRLGVLFRGSMASREPLQSVMTDGQYATLELDNKVRRVVIVVRDLANEFEDDLDDRTALVDFGAIVIENIARGVEYIYVTQDLPKNRLRARRVAVKTGQLCTKIRVSFVSIDGWRSLPVQSQTVFLRDDAGGEEGYMLLPNGNGKADRYWMRLSHEYRDDWLSVLEDQLKAASSVEP